MKIDISDDLLKEIHDLLYEPNDRLTTKEEWKEYIEDILKELHEIT
jgi:hypothetical protein